MDKKNRKQIFRSAAVSVCALAVAAFAGCAEEVQSLFTDGTEVQVNVSFADAEKAFTRAADGLNGSGFTLTTTDNGQSLVRVMVDQGDGNYSGYTYNITGANVIGASGTAPKFNSGVSSVNVYGWYPFTDKGLTGFTVSDTQTGPEGYCLSDLMFAESNTCTRNAETGAVTKPAALSFTHVMAKVKVNLELATGVTVESAKFLSMKNTVTVNPTKEDDNTISGYTFGEISGSTDITLLTGGSVTSDILLCGVFPKQEKNGAFLEIKAKYNNGASQTITYRFSSAKTFKAGKVYTMNISLNGTNVTTGEVELIGWDAESGTVNIGGGGSLELQTDDSSGDGYLTIETVSAQQYTGSEVEPKPTVQTKINGTSITLREGTDFDFLYENNTAKGNLTATLTVKGKGIFSGSVSQNFSIVTVVLPAIAESQANNPLYYMAEYNYNGSGFYSDNDAKDTYWMCTWVWANDKASQTLSGASGYHIPTKGDWVGILPEYSASSVSNLFSVATGVVTPFSESSGGTIKNGTVSLPVPDDDHKSVYSGTGSGTTTRVVYAVRYINTDYCSIWKYTREATNTTTIASGGRLTIESYVASTKITSTQDATYLLQDLADGSQSWPASGTVKRVLPACGYKSNLGGTSNPGTAVSGNQSSLSSSGERCSYWSSTESSSDNGWILGCYGNFLYVGSGGGKRFGFPLRLFRDN